MIFSVKDRVEANIFLRNTKSPKQSTHATNGNFLQFLTIFSGYFEENTYSQS
jgi:hypothetical protein